MTEPMMQPGKTLPDPVEFMSEETNAECAAFQASMADMIGEGEDLQKHPHMATCERCRALVFELEAIAEAARGLFPPEEEPDEQLWNKIESKLGMPAMEEEETGMAEKSDETPKAPELEGGLGLAFEGGVA